MVSVRSVDVLGTFVLYVTVLRYYVFRFFAILFLFLVVFFRLFLKLSILFTDRVQRHVILLGQLS